MAKTNYNECWWLIQALDGKWGQGSYRNGTGYSLLELNNLRPMGARIARDVWYDKENIDAVSRRDKFRQDTMRWRAIIYNEFGLGIKSGSDPGIIKKKGLGGHYYYLVNPELLDERGKTLREHIQFLADTEKKKESLTSLSKMSERFSEGTSMGFISAGGPSSFGYLSKDSTSYRTVLGEENIEIIQFAIQFGEVLTIKYGKVRAGVDINAPYSFEPYQLKEIEGRWYVIGNLYPLGHKESAELAIYDLARLQFADEENPDVLYEPVKGFDINEKIECYGIIKHRSRRKVIALNLLTHTEELANYFTRYPLCSAQVDLGRGQFKIYIRYTYDLIVQLGAYGAELSFEVIHDPGQNLHSEMDLFRNTDE